MPRHASPKKTASAINTIRRGSPNRAVKSHNTMPTSVSGQHSLPTEPILSGALEAWVWERERAFQAFRASAANLKLRAAIGKLVHEQVPQADLDMCQAYAGSFLARTLFWEHESLEIGMDGDKLLDFADSIAEAMVAAQRKAERRGELYRQERTKKSARRVHKQ